MANVLDITADNPDELLSAGVYGAGAVIRVQSSATEAGVYADLSGTGSTPTIALVSGTGSYAAYDPAGAATTWYRTRFENVGATRISVDWTDLDWAAQPGHAPFQVDAGGGYVTSELLKLRANIGDVVDDTLIEQVCAEVNAWIETFTGRILRPFTYTNQLFDGWGYPYGDVTDYGRGLMVPNGIRSITSLEVANATGGSFVDITADAFMRSGTPATRIVLSNVPTLGVYTFLGGYANIRLTGAGGPASVPEDVRGVAVAIAVRAWNGRQSGHTDIVGNDQLTGNPVVSRWVASEDKQTLMRYQPALVG
jgi:hypothetical protein